MNTPIEEWMVEAVKIMRRIVPTPEDLEGAEFQSHSAAAFCGASSERCEAPDGESSGEGVPADRCTNGDAASDMRDTLVGPRADAQGRSSRPSSGIWVSYNSRHGRTLSMTEEDHNELIRPGEFVSDTTVDLWIEEICSQCFISPSSSVTVGCSPGGFDRLAADAFADGSCVIQPIFDAGGNHFVALAIRGSNIYFMDSLGIGPPNPNGGMMRALRQLVGPGRMIVNLPVQQQSPRSNLCGLHCVARLTEFAYGVENPELSVFDEDAMRRHAELHLELGFVLRFPRIFPAPASMRFAERSIFYT